jgi:N-acetyl-gamma-glutamyl-phosphate reductase
MTKRVGIIGASGYAGHELTKLLTGRKDVEVKVLNSRSYAGRKVRDLYTDYAGDEAYTGYSFDKINSLGLDLVFLALPHGQSAAAVMQLDPQTRIIDLSADYRFSKEAVYGLPELFSKQIKTARIVANPGCYATAAILSAYPVQEHAGHIIFDCKSGWSGAGRDSEYARDATIAKDDLIPYHLTRHRHKYEIEQFVKTKVSFTPHILDTFRGILCTAHILLKDDITAAEVASVYQTFYQDHPFVRVSPGVPRLSDTQGSNFCNIGGFEIDESNQLVVVSTIDNLLKGAAGQAVQNMNLMLGFGETVGLK